MLLKPVFCAGNACSSSYIYSNAPFIPKKQLNKNIEKWLD